MDINSIVASGMQTMRLKAEAHAHNVANARTPGYQRLDVSTTERPQGGVDLSVERDPSSGLAPYNGESLTSSADSQLSAGSNSAVDIVTDLVGMKEAAHGMDMLASLYHRNDEMLGTMLDIFG